MKHLSMLRKGSLFEWAQDTYNNTKPVNGSKTPKSMDVRPLGKRSKKHERIVKIDENTYLLEDTQYAWANVYGGNGTYYYDDDKLEAQAPIRITRNEQGDTVLRIGITGQGTYQANRIDFLNRYLPAGIDIVSRSRGKTLRYVCLSGRTKYFLPQHSLSVTNSLPTDSGWNYITLVETADRKFKLAPDSKTFEDNIGKVNKELKAEFKNDISEFVTWAIGMSNILRPQANNEGQREYWPQWLLNVQEHSEALVTDMHTQGVDVRGVATLLYNCDYVATVTKLNIGIRNKHGDQGDYFRNVIRDRDHPQRAVLATILLSVAGFYHEQRRGEGYESFRAVWDSKDKEYKREAFHTKPLSEDEIRVAEQRVRSKINKVLNKLCSFTNK